MTIQKKQKHTECDCVLLLMAEAQPGTAGLFTLDMQTLMRLEENGLFFPFFSFFPLLLEITANVLFFFLQWKSLLQVQTA